MRIRVGLLIAVLAVFAGPRLGAHEGHTHRYMGTIATVTDTQVSLTTTGEKTVTFRLDATTRITRGKQAGTKRDLTVGARAVVEADGGKEPALAKTIKLAAAPPPKTS